MNSIKVRLEHFNQRGFNTPLVNFNSIKVRLELNPNETFKIGYSFQFHKGTIRTIDRNYLCSTSNHFNSIKVRLERNAFGVDDAILLFQFHKGTIRTH